MPSAASLSAMEAVSRPDLPEGKGWWFEPKWDGFRCLARRSGRRVDLIAKSGKPLTRYFPEVVARFAALKCDCFVLDGELVVPEGKSFSFDALQQRLHPAQSRIDKLSMETPARFLAFDLLFDEEDLRGKPHGERHSRLSAFLRRCSGGIELTPGTADRRKARGWLKGGYEGVVAKDIDGPYLGGERAMVKVKRIRTADCVVGGFRYATEAKVVGSLLLGLYNDEGLLDHVGFTSGFADVDRKALTRRLEKLKGGGFTGNAPGGPSRWTTERSAEWVPLRPELVVEVSFDHVSGGRFRHGTNLIRFRPDKAPRQCRMEQIG